jgi:hypothetical protein
MGISVARLDTVQDCYHEVFMYLPPQRPLEPPFLTFIRRNRKGIEFQCLSHTDPWIFGILQRTLGGMSW